ncbi:unnamed protein product [Polarella glacialis]|uniref:Dihydroxy-acid/6-phosphogluconate dehydratase N-terminal domain-containing protein n=1 Tax=Polarella glacialis TaxID=89957 RepID=A0A813HJP7_POLGL|nr:unnamed protein product [Polarella glacialis]CAE8615284.1 unnamed protein product [Polarella glacialis]CAE8637780.1 unnamed protein product [Polarella glacialis]
MKKESFKITGDPTKPDGAPNSFVKMTCARSNFRAAGWQEEDFKKPVITIAAPYSNSMPCNNQFRDLADILAEEVEKLGGKAHLCFTPVISDGQSQGSKAMRYSLVSREVITDCIEMMHEGYHADAIITLGGCDKSVPAAIMPLARKDLIGLSLFGGPALPGLHPGERGHKALQQQTVRDPKCNNNKQQQQQQQEQLFVPCSNEVYDLAQVAVVVAAPGRQQKREPRWILAR